MCLCVSASSLTPLPSPEGHTQANLLEDETCGAELSWPVVQAEAILDQQQPAHPETRERDSPAQQSLPAKPQLTTDSCVRPAETRGNSQSTCRLGVTTCSWLMELRFVVACDTASVWRQTTGIPWPSTGYIFQNSTVSLLHAAPTSCPRLTPRSGSEPRVFDVFQMWVWDLTLPVPSSLTFHKLCTLKPSFPHL